MDIPPILAPAAALVLWSLIVLLWLAITRARNFHVAGITLDNIPRGARMSDVEQDRLPERERWVSNNYTHLMEQPTLFYAIVAVLAIAGDMSRVSLVAAWCYVGLRVLHSLWQACINIVGVRAVLFALSTACLVVLAIRAVRITVL